MQVSSDFEDFVLSIAEKGFHYDQILDLVVTDFSLSQDEKKKIYVRMSDFGYHSEREMDVAISAICDSLETGCEAKEISLAELSLGTTIKLNRKFNQCIKILYIEDSFFYVLEDSFGALAPGDKLLLIGGGIAAGKDVYFRVIRNEKNYPSDDMLFRLNDVVSIFCVWPKEIVNHKNGNQSGAIKKSYTEAFSWQPSLLENETGVAFVVQNIHLNKEAMFVLNLKDCEFSLNKGCNIQVYAEQKINWFDVLKLASDIVGDGVVSWNKVEMLLPGSFQIQDGVLVITKKMRVRL